MELGLKNRRALVSGSTAGIGYAIARELAREGAEVILNGRTQGRVDRALASLRQAVPDAKLRGVPADLSGAAGASELVSRIAEIDILINNVGVFEPRSFDQIADAEWLRMFETNVLSGVRLARAYVPGMKRRGWGRVIFISSESGLNVPVEMIHYGMSKTAQLAIASGLAKDCAGTGVTSNAILVGPTASEGVGAFVDRLARERGVTRAQMDEDFFRSARPTSLLKRFIAPEEAAHLVVYVASDLASATTGAALRADGGVVPTIV